MSLMNSKTKTWLKRNGFRGEGKPRKAMRECNGYVERSGRKFRIRLSDGVADIGEPISSFARWANSCEKTISLEQFFKEYGRGIKP